MSADLFEQLAQQEVPPLPENFGKRVHQRLNRALVVLHVAELLLRVLPYCAVVFARAVVGMISYTVSGRFPEERSSRSDGEGRT